MLSHEGRPQDRWAVQVSNDIIREVGVGQWVPLPSGHYTLAEFDRGIYRLSRDGGPTVILSRREVGTYIRDRRLTPLDGAWP
jgi:hypothetical protein